jgi:hypothetical protein
MKQERKAVWVVSFFLMLWCLASSKEFYLNYSVGQIKKHQKKVLFSMRESSVTKTILVHSKTQEILLEGKDELYYQDTLYDVVSIKRMAGDSIQYVLLSDCWEQSLLSLLFGNKSNGDTNNLAAVFHYKFIAIFLRDDFAVKKIMVERFLIIRSGVNGKYLPGFVHEPLQPPD